MTFLNVDIGDPGQTQECAVFWYTADRLIIESMGKAGCYPIMRSGFVAVVAGPMFLAKTMHLYGSKYPDSLNGRRGTFIIPGRKAASRSEREPAVGIDFSF